MIFRVFLAYPSTDNVLQFLPVIGRIVSDAIEGRLDPATAQKFALDRKHSTLDQLDSSRGSLGPVDITNESLCTLEDLLT